MTAIGPLLGGGSLSRSSIATLGSSMISMNTTCSSGNEIIPDHFNGIFLESLYRISQNAHPGFAIQREALCHIEGLLSKLLSEILNKHPRTIADVDQHVQQCYPHPLDSWTVREAQEALSKLSHKKIKENHLYVSAQRIISILKDKAGWKTDCNVIMYILAAMEYVGSDILKLCGNYVKNIRHNEIALQDLKVAMRADTVLMDLFYRDSEDVVPSPLMDDILQRRNNTATGAASISYEQTVRDLLHAETQYLRDLNIIVNVYRRAFLEIPQVKREHIDGIFANIVEIHELTVRFIGLLEDTMEMTREGCPPAVGSCFLETAEGAEYDVYERYALDILNTNQQTILWNVLECPAVKNALHAKGAGFFLSVKYLLPKLLPLPIAHSLQYFEFLAALKRLSADPDDQEDLRQTESLLCVLKSRMEHDFYPAVRKRLTNYITLRLAPSGHYHAGYAKLMELQKIVEGWESRALNIPTCSGFVCEGDVGKVSSPATSKLSSAILSPDGLWTKAARVTERRCFLFETVFILCKPLARRSGVTAGGQPELRLKELMFIRRFDLIDKEDTDELKNAFELRSKDPAQELYTLVAKTPEEKANWMAALIMLIMRSTLERMLDSYLDGEEKRVPLSVPSKELYRFGEVDGEDNIVFEDYTSSSGVPVVRGATLTKLVERLTYYQYPDPRFVRTFLTTYRAFCSSNELLALLIERFRVPDNAKALLGEQADENDPFVRETLKKFRKGYMQPTQIRVLNVIRQWVDHHWYDFDGDPDLLNELKAFLNDIKYPNTIIKWTTSLLHIIERKCDTKEEIKGFQFPTEPPPIEWHITESPDQYDLMKLHPVEIARQVTLLEFDLYRAVKPIELVGAAWTKKDKDKRSPQLLKLIRHSTKFTYWLEKCIVECGNIEERVAVMNRILEIMCVFQELNNFTGLIEIYGVLESSAVHRLDFTWNRLDQKLYKEFKKVKMLLSDAHHKHIREKLRSIDPPCVPFFGMYLSNIIFLEEGNPVFLKMPLSNQTSEADAPSGDVPNSVHEKSSSLMISFTKCRKIAEIIGEIQMYQNQPYCLTVEPNIRYFFESLDPLAGHPDKNEFEKFLYERSLEIEPKECDKAPYFPPTRIYSLKSPGIEMRHKTKLKNRSTFINPLTPALSSGRSISTVIVPSAPSTAPPSPSAMSVIDITAGSTPRFLGDIGHREGNDDWLSKKASATIPRLTHHQPQPTQGTDEDGTRKSEPPKIPPRNRVNSLARDLPQPVRQHFIFPSQTPEPATWPPPTTAEKASDHLHDTISTSTVAGPPLPPRTPRTSQPTEPPPPRPPKRDNASSGNSSGVPPPLPPKTYNKKTE